MARLTFPERLKFAAISVERGRRGMVSRALNSRSLRWRYGAPRADQLLIVPQDIRSNDPSFWYEVQHGQFGLGGSLARLDGRSPFDIVAPARAWQSALFGFGWLRHMQAADEPAAAEAARELAVEWIIRHGKGTGEAWRPEILARRVISWLSHAGLLLEGADERTYTAISTSLGMQLVRLSSAWREAPEGEPRLLALIALVLSDLCIAGRDRRLDADVPLLVAELGQQILADGGHASRNGEVAVELLLDLMPLRQCFRARSRPHPPQLDEAITEMLSLLRYLRLGDGLLARFNGVSAGSPARLATVLAYADLTAPVRRDAVNSGYERLQMGETVLIADCGGPPPLALAAGAHAGCLSFELSSGADVLISNGGAPPPASADWLPAARATASHNTLVLGETSSSRLAGNRRIEDMLGGLPIRGPETVEVQAIESGADQIGFEASHDGYLKAFGMVHQRRLVIEAGGRRVVGTDRLKPPRGILRLKKDIPFSIHFHLHPGVSCKRGDVVGTAIIEVEGQRWKLAAEGARLGIEESHYFADTVGPSRRLQVVLRGATFGEAEVRWALTRLA